MPVTRHPLTPENRHLQNVPVDQAVIARLEESLRHMNAPGKDLPAAFYHTLFSRHPALRAMFPKDMTAQKKKLLDAVVMVVEHLRAPEQVRLRLHELGAAHVGYGARPQHYPLVCAAILEGMRTTSGESWSDELAHEWRTALDLVSEIMLEGARAAKPSNAARK